MIKIIRKGNIKKEAQHKKKFECKICGCIFEATEEHWKDISQCGPIVYGVRCPACNMLAMEVPKK